MKADYKNWVPNGMIYGFGAAATGLAALAGVIKKRPLSTLLGVGVLGCGAWTAWCVYANSQFSYIWNMVFVVEKITVCNANRNSVALYQIT